MRFYLIVHICIGILIIGFELFYRWLIQRYQMYVRICPDVVYIELKQLNKIQSFNWLENKINNLVQAFYSINKQCFSKELKLNFNSIFLYLRYLWLSISGGLYSYFALKHIVKLEKYQKNLSQSSLLT